MKSLINNSQTEQFTTTVLSEQEKKRNAENIIKSYLNNNVRR